MATYLQRLALRPARSSPTGGRPATARTIRTIGTGTARQTACNHHRRKAPAQPGATPPATKYIQAGLGPIATLFLDFRDAGPKGTARHGAKERGGPSPGLYRQGAPPPPVSRLCPTSRGGGRAR